MLTRGTKCHMSHNLRLLASPMGECCGAVQRVEERHRAQTCVFSIHELPSNHPNCKLKCIVSRDIRYSESIDILDSNNESNVTMKIRETHIDLYMYSFLLPSVKLLAVTFAMKVLLQHLKSHERLFCPDVEPFKKNYFAYRQPESMETFAENYNEIMSDKNKLCFRGSARDFDKKILFLDALYPSMETSYIILKLKCTLHPNAMDLKSAEVLTPSGLPIVLIKYSADGKLSTVMNHYAGIIGTVDRQQIKDATGTRLADIEQKGQGRRTVFEGSDSAGKMFTVNIGNSIDSVELSVDENAGWRMNVLALAFALKAGFMEYKLHQYPLPRMEVIPSLADVDGSGEDD